MLVLALTTLSLFTPFLLDFRCYDFRLKTELRFLIQLDSSCILLGIFSIPVDCRFFFSYFLGYPFFVTVDYGLSLCTYFSG